MGWILFYFVNNKFAAGKNLNVFVILRIDKK